MAPPVFPPLESLPPSYVAEDNSRPLLITCITFLTLETAMMLLLYTSRFLSSEKKANWNMVALMTGAYFVCLCKITIGFLSIHIGGAGHHTVTLSPRTITTALQLNTALQLVCPLTTSLAKMSILSLFNTLFGRTSARYRLVIRATFVLCLLTMIVQVIIPFANCKPFSATWTLGMEDRCAINGLYLWRYLSIPNVITTLIMICIPIPALYKLQVSTATKLGLAVVLSVCVCGVVAAIGRFASFLTVMSFEDFSYEQVTPQCWTIAESGVYMVAGVLPTLRPLMRKLFGGVRFEKILSGRFRSSKGSGSGDSWGNKNGSVMVMKGDEVALVKKGKGFSMLSAEDTVVEDDEEKEKV